MTRSTDQKKTLRGLFYAAQLGSKAAATKVKETLEALRVGPRRKPAAPAPRKAAPVIRKAAPAPKRAAAVRKEPQPVSGNDLLLARDYADRARTKARSLARAVRNASPAEMSFCRLAAQLPGRRPTEASTLREWRAYAAAVESLKPAITKTGVRF